MNEENLLLGEEIILLDEETITNDPTVVYPVEFLQKEFCTDFTSMSVTDFGACSNYVTLELTMSYFSLFLGLAIGFIIAKAVSDSWS